MGYHLTQQAEEDLITLYVDGVEKFGVAQAEAYFAKVEAAFGRIAEFPGMARLREEFSPPVRIYRMDAHIVIYRVDDQGDVLIVRVRHGREDWLSEPSVDP